MVCFLSRLRRSFIFIALSMAGVLACSPGVHAAAFTPKLGQSGKDVMWLPTPDALVTRLLKMAQLTSADTLVDLGAGDGKIVIAAARDFGAQARGVEYDPRLIDVAQAAAKQAGVDSRTRFIQGDIFEADFSDVDVVAMYLLPQLNLRLRPTLLAMKPGTRIVTHWFDMGEWKADETTEVENRPGYLWVVPANVHGTWQVQPARAAAGGGAANVASPIDELTFTQRYQMVEGVLALSDVKASLLEPALVGSHLSFGFTDLQGVRQQARATIEGNVMQVQVRPWSRMDAGESSATATAPWTFTAHRVGNADPLPGSEPAGEAEMNAAIASLGNE